MNARSAWAGPPQHAETAAAPLVLIVNPASFRASRGLAERAASCAARAGAEVVRLDGPASLDAALAAILARRQSRVAVLAGDGTVQGVVDRLAKLPAGSWKPDLLVLPGGRSNLTANDLVPPGDVTGAIERAVCRARDGHWDEAVVERAVLRVEQEGSPPRHGFFVAAALIDGAIRRIHARRAARPGAVNVGLATTVGAVLRLGAAAAAGRSGLSCPELELDAGALGRFTGPARVLLLTTLHHERGLFDPYAERGAGDLRVAVVGRAARRFWWRLPRVLTGRYSAAMNAASAYLSGRCDRVSVAGLSGCMLDGEPIDTDPSRPVVISAGPRLRFLVP